MARHDNTTRDEDEIIGLLEKLHLEDVIEIIDRLDTDLTEAKKEIEDANETIKELNREVNR